ncbi:MAG: hypothetical protein R2684_10735 [Pyrinomonadaceae bacterium]
MEISALTNTGVNNSIPPKGDSGHFDFASILDDLFPDRPTQQKSDCSDVSPSVDTRRGVDSRVHAGDSKKDRQDPDSDDPKSDRNQTDLSAPSGSLVSNLKPSQVFDASTLFPQSIIHVVDLERIVSSARIFGCENGAIAEIRFVRSVFEGLGMRLAFSDGKLRGEFLTADPAVQKILESKLGELSSMLESRGIRCGSLTVGGDSAFDTGSQQNRDTSPNFPVASLKRNSEEREIVSQSEPILEHGLSYFG